MDATMIITQAAIRERLRNIKKERDRFHKENNPDFYILLSAQEFMGLMEKYKKNKGKYCWQDNPACSFVGLFDAEEYLEYFCPMEDLSEDQFQVVDNLRPKPN